MRERPVLIAGAGIAGLTAALAFAARGFPVEVVERAAALQDAGAGVQLSPNATRILIRLGLGEPLRAVSVQPDAVVLLEARTLRERARVPLGRWGERRWAAPYLVLHRAALQRVLLDAVGNQSSISLSLAAEVIGASAVHASLTFLSASDMRQAAGSFLIGADGVRSAVRHALEPSAALRETGLTAYRAMLPPESAGAFEEIMSGNRVAAVLHSHAHLIAYPMRSGAFNLVAFAPRFDGDQRAALLKAFAGSHRLLLELIAHAPTWSAWPLLLAPRGLTKWTFGETAALIGDAAHAMAPFAAQGAAMAIEDAETLAAALSQQKPRRAALAEWERGRRRRIARVERRGRLNQLAWHAAGPVAFARNLLLRARTPEKLAADLDWLYGGP